MRLFLYQLVFPLLLVLAGVGPAAGTTPPAPRPHPVADTTAPSLDTARVLGQFFAHQRKVNRPLLLPSAVAAVAFHYVLAYSKSETTFQQVSRGFNMAWVTFFTYRLGKSIVQLRRYRVGREHILLAALAHGQPLPRPVRQQLLTYLRPVSTK